MAKQYRWTHPKPLGRANPTIQNGLQLPGPDREANFIRQGEVFTPTEAELESFSDRIEEVKEGEKK